MWQANSRWEKRQAKVLVGTLIFLFVLFFPLFSRKEIFIYSKLMFCQSLSLYGYAAIVYA